MEERKKAEDALRKNENRSRTLLENLPQKIFFKDRRLVYVSCNENYARDLKIKSSEIAGRTDYEFYPKKLAEKYRADDKRIMESGETEDIEEEYIQDGQRVFVHTVKTPVKDENDNVVGILGIFWDISDHKKVAEELRNSEERFRNLFESAGDGILTIDLRGRVTSANKKIEEISGLSREEIIGKHPTQFARMGIIGLKDMPLIMKGLKTRIKGQPSKVYEFKIKNKKGQEKFVEFRGSLIKKMGKPIGVLEIVRDVTKRKMMEEKLRQYSEHLEELIQKRTEELLESETRYSVLVEEARDGVAILQDGKITFANKRGPEIVGYSRGELIGLPFEKLVDEKYRQFVKERYERRLRREKVPATYEIEVTAKSGARVPVELSATRINYQGRPADLIIVRDISERKRIEAQRLKLEKLAAIGELATMVGHDLRNPLQSIENAAYVLTNEMSQCVNTHSVSIPQKAKEMLQIINNSINYADRIIKDLQDFSATKKPVFKKNNINTIVKEVLSQIKAPKNVKLITELNSLPEIKADKDMTKRVFLNLTMNGIQAMKNGGTLKISTKKTRDFVEVSFKDTGTGMPKEKMEKLFTPFFTTRAKGMGMGLAICKKFVDAHDGNITVESEEGKGTTFTVKLPIQ